jgi:sodium/hydrogen antiporter
MAFGWVVCAIFIKLIFRTDIPTAMIISACLTPTDPVLAASVLANSHFSTRVPKRIRDLLSAESGCNDGVSFPFLYIGLSILTRSTVGGIIKKWVLITILYQCLLGTILGLAIGHFFNIVYTFSHKREMVRKFLLQGASWRRFVECNLGSVSTSLLRAPIFLPPFKNSH